MPEFSPSPDGGAVRQIASSETGRRSPAMAALDLPSPLAARLDRQFIAVCDSVKAAGADEQAPSADWPYSWQLSSSARDSRPCSRLAMRDARIALIFPGTVRVAGRGNSQSARPPALGEPLE